MQYFYCLIINILDNFSESFLDLLQLAQATVIDSISMNFYIVKPDSRLQMFNFYRGKFLPKYCSYLQYKISLHPKFAII